ncbi:MAG: tetratricopeptide repeat protein [Clostridiales bacterium]|nr:tetratricopeptide repeat protein [Clostridiales bacterium]
MYDYKKDYGKAEKYLRKCLDLDSSYPEADRSLMICLSNQKKYAEALKFFNSRKKKAKTPSLYYGAAYMYGEQKKL